MLISVLYYLISQSLTKSLKKKVGTELDMKNVITGFTLDIITSCAFGLEPDSINNPDHPLKNISRMFGKRKWIHGVLAELSRAFPQLVSVGR